MADNGPRLKQAYYDKPIADFVKEIPQTILGHLAEHHAHDLDPAQRAAWLAQIEILQRELKSLESGWIALEFSIPRMGKRADAIIILDHVIFVIEFKIGAIGFDLSAIDQVIDYSLDLKNFHSGSHDRPVVPVLIATAASPKPVQLSLWHDAVAEPILSNGTDLDRLLRQVVSEFCKQDAFTPDAWMAAGYKPTPTIIEAAQALYRSHRVEDITRSDAGAKNLSVTNDRISRIIEAAKADRKKVICFVTGVPGAGKTLAGLNLVTHRTKAHEDEHAVFLSGNGPLVDVLREALARDEKVRGEEVGHPINVGEARRKVKSFIQNIHHFRDANLTTNDPPIEKVVVFDEAQRAWDANKISKFMKDKHGIQDFGTSEPEFLISVMNRHSDWCAIVCLIGGGQEINDGEAGLTEWFSALKNKYRDWRVFTSDQLQHPDYHWGRDLAGMLSGLNHCAEQDLHLSVSVRSFRAEKLSSFVNELISGNSSVARQIYQEIQSSYPIALTRDLSQARVWLRARARGSERFGLVASSGASRLKPEGINVHEKINAPYWFLNSKDDVRASFYLEDPATEFDIQGLELDWIGVCWDADFRRADGRWSHHMFRGTKWNNLKDRALQAYLANAYRVLLTRARQGMVIYVPLGELGDPTRPPSFYDGIASYLAECGIEAVH